MTKTFATLFLGALAGIASAQFFVTDWATGATALAEGDDAVTSVNVGNGGIRLFGTSYNTVGVSTNGILTFSGNNDYASDVFPNTTSGPTIAALWSDWFVDADLNYSGAWYRDDADKFVATWTVRLVDDETIQGQFQAVVQKATGHIFIGVGSLDSRYMNYSSTNANLTGLNGGVNGLFSEGNVRNVTMANSQRAYLYDANTNRYEAVPEPASLVALGLGAVLLRRRRRTA